MIYQNCVGGGGGGGATKTRNSEPNATPLYGACMQPSLNLERLDSLSLGIYSNYQLLGKDLKF